MKTLVLHERLKLTLREFPIEREEAMGPRDMWIKLRTVGVCGSDVHYYTHGGIGQFQLKAPMILGHEASGTVVECGAEVQTLKVGDRVCMEPGIPDPNSRATRMGVHAATKAQIKPGDVGLVQGAGPIGLVTALAALAAGCARVFIADVDETKLALAESLGPITGINAAKQDQTAEILKATEGWGVEVVFECSGHPRAAGAVFDALCPGGRVVFVGIPVVPFAYDLGKAMAREARVEQIFRYAHVFPRCVGLLAGGGIDVKPLITRTFGFDEAVHAFEIAASAPKGQVKMQIDLPQ